MPHPGRPLSERVLPSLVDEKKSPVVPRHDGCLTRSGNGNIRLDNVRSAFLSCDMPSENVRQILPCNPREARPRAAILLFFRPRSQPFFFGFIADLVANRASRSPTGQWNGVRAPLQAGGCSTRVWMRRERWRDGRAAGGHPRFFRDTYPAILDPSPAPTSCRKRTGAGLDEHPMRDLVKPGLARRPGAVPAGSRGKGRIRKIAHRVKPEWRVAGRCGGKGVSEKMRMAPCRASIRLPFPTNPGKPRRDPRRPTCRTRCRAS
jgi:hypothetical protein